MKGINIGTLLYRKSSFLKNSLMQLFFPAIDVFIFLLPSSKHNFNMLMVKSSGGGK